MTYRAISTAQPNDTPSQDQLLDSKINVSLRGGSRLNIQLLRDIAKVWKTPDDFIPSKDLATALRKDENLPWLELELTLAKAGVAPGEIRYRTQAQRGRDRARVSQVSVQRRHHPHRKFRTTGGVS